MRPKSSVAPPRMCLLERHLRLQVTKTPLTEMTNSPRWNYSSEACASKATYKFLLFSVHWSTSIVSRPVSPALLEVCFHPSVFSTSLIPILGMSCTRHRVFLAALIISAKYLNDSSPKCKHWARYSTLFSVQEVNLCERQLLYLLDYDLRITDDDLLLHFSPFMPRQSRLPPLLRARRSRGSLYNPLSTPPLSPCDATMPLASPGESPMPKTPSDTRTLRSALEAPSQRYRRHVADDSSPSTLYSSSDDEELMPVTIQRCQTDKVLTRKTSSGAMLTTPASPTPAYSSQSQRMLMSKQPANVASTASHQRPTSTTLLTRMLGSFSGTSSKGPSLEAPVMRRDRRSIA